MVGIPRSGGCHTCRRRRIRCDQQRPHCQRCETDNKSCEGYHKWPIFINRGLEGFQKRHRLEEVIVNTPSPTNSQGSEPPPLVSQTSSISSGSSGSSPSQNGLAKPSSKPIKPGTLDLANKTLLSRFLEIYLPTSVLDRGSATEVWLTEVCDITEPSPVLKLALHALAAGRVGDAENNPDLLEESRSCYGECLALLRRVLRAGDDQVLMASRCLMIFEVFSATMSSPGAWESHVKGLVDIATARGPRGFAPSPVLAALLVDIKAGSMLGCIHHSSLSPFTAAKWHPSRPSSSIDEFEAEVLHIGLDLAALYNEEKRFRAESKSDLPDIKSLVARLDDITSRCSASMAGLSQLRPRSGGSDSESSPSERPDFWNLESAVITSICLTLQADAYVSVGVMLDQLARLAGLSVAERRSLAPFSETQEEGWFEEVGLRVVTAVSYMTGEEMGIYGAQRSLFPLWMMINLQARGSVAYSRADELYLELIEKRKVRRPLDFPHQEENHHRRIKEEYLS